MWMLYGSLLFPALVGWYTFNTARIAWAEGNKTGAVAAAVLALLAAGFPTVVVLLNALA